MSEFNLNNSTRPTWKEYFKQLVTLTSTRSTCEKLHVGCLFVKDNRIVAQGYNGYLPNNKHVAIFKDNHNIATIHAEQNTIADCAKRGVSSDGCTAYITHYPCYNCMKLLVTSGIHEINYIDDYNNDKLVEEIAISNNIKINKLE